MRTKLVFLGALTALLYSLTSDTWALMAGLADDPEPDSPALRVDRNTVDSPWASVGSVTVRGETYSGVLIAPSYVLTAAHVVRDAPPQDIIFNLNLDAHLSLALAVSNVVVHPAYKGFNASGISFNDLALLKLTQAAPAAITIHPILDQAMAVGTVLTLVGYGASGQANHGVSIASSASVKRSGQNAIEGFAPQVKRFAYPLAYIFTFDPPFLADKQANPRSTGNRRETITASGDSGGPAFVQRDGVWHLAGINTFVLKPNATAAMGEFGLAAGGMWLPAYAQWIDDTMQLLSRQPAKQSGAQLDMRPAWH